MTLLHSDLHFGLSSEEGQRASAESGVALGQRWDRAWKAEEGGLPWALGRASRRPQHRRTYMAGRGRRTLREASVWVWLTPFRGEE